MLTRLATPLRCLAIGCLSCLAYEAIRINGWYNRFPVESQESETFFRVYAIDRWEPWALGVYTAMLLPPLVIHANRHKPRIQRAVVLFALVMLAALAASIPDAHHGRFGGTHHLFLLAHVLLVFPVGMGLLLVGLMARKGQGMRHGPDD